MEHAPHVLTAVKLGTQHWDKIRDPARRRIESLRNNERPDPHVTDHRTMEDKGYVLRKRSEVQSDEEIVEVVRHRGEVLPRRPRNRRQASSVDGARYRRDAGGYGSESEGSVPPRSRRGRPSSARSKRGRSSSSSKSSSSDLGSTTDEEKEIKKMRRKKWITAALASVATIHAASKVYTSIEKHDKRVIAVSQGELSPEEAHKQARSARWQDAAAIGIAALGIKGSISEWKEMKEEHEKHKELCEKHEEQHRKRLEHQRRKAATDKSGYYKGRDGNWYYDGPEAQYSQRSRSRAQSMSNYDSRKALDGPRQNERKMIEGPPPRDRSAYGRDRSRARSVGRGGDDDSASPVRARSRRGSPSRRQALLTNPLTWGVLATPALAVGAYQLTKKDIQNEPILPSSQRDEFLKQYHDDQHGEYQDFGLDAVEEILDKIAG